MNQRESIYEFVRANPDCTTAQIRAALGLNLVQIGQCLIRLKSARMVESEWLRYEPQTWRAVPKNNGWAKALGV